jgi:chlorobactene glucosyltransferase
MELYLVLVSFSLLLLLLNVLNNLRLLVRPREDKQADRLPFVSVLIPARNEENRIEGCLRSLLSQDYPNFEVIVLDDDSEDRTSEVVRRFVERHPNLSLVRGDPLPLGWTGKNFACHQLSKKARGEWLLFTDADTVHRPGCLRRAVQTAVREDAALLTLLPHILRGSVGEELFMPMINFAFLNYLPLGLINVLKEPRLTAAMGPFMLLKADLYRRIGGHRAISECIVDDVHMARQVKKHGGRVIIADGTDDLDIRFYQNLREIWDGFSKNAFGAFDYSVPTMLGFVFVNLSLFVMPYVLLVLGLLGGHVPPLVYFQVGVISVGRVILALRFRTNVLASLFHPVVFLIGFGLLFNSAFLSILGRSVLWKDRTYGVHRGV